MKVGSPVTHDCFHALIPVQRGKVEQPQKAFPGLAPRRDTRRTIGAPQVGQGSSAGEAALAENWLFIGHPDAGWKAEPNTSGFTFYLKESAPGQSP